MKYVGRTSSEKPAQAFVWADRGGGARLEERGTQKMAIKDPHGKQLREHVLYLLNGGGAHARYDDVVKNVPEALRGAKPNGLPHTAWMLLEHLRLAQWDILEFSRNG